MTALDYHYRTNAQVLGATQQGKSKLVEWFASEHILNHAGFAILDFKGTLYRNVLACLSYLQPDQPIVLLNPSESEWITPFNPFQTKGDVSAHASRMAEVILKTWGGDINLMPTYEPVVKMVLTFC